MPKLRFANVLLETNPRSLQYPSLYCLSDRPFIQIENSDEWDLRGPGTFDFTTYFNSLSVKKLLQYTIGTTFSLHLEIRGAACTLTQTMGDAFSSTSQAVSDRSRSIDASDEWQSIDLDLRLDPSWVIVGFSIQAQGEISIRNGYYAVGYSGELRPVELVLATTTFKKESYVEGNIALVRKNILESGEPEFAEHFNMLVIDNGRTLDAEKLSGNHVSVIPNNNVGGAGGFTRGMIMAMDQHPKATNVLLMDDDVAVSPESIKRTYRLLQLLKDEYKDAFISGAMLNYEIGDEQWEDLGYMTPEGTFCPVKPPLRLTKFEDLIFNELFKPMKFMKKQMYAAWWYCCIPVSMIERNGLPLPVFVRCDDAEFGVRCQPKFITMNSLCIWHMSFHLRYNPAVERYQTVRNTMIAQSTTGFALHSDFMYQLHNNIRLELKKFGYENAELCLDAFEDYMKGPKFIGQPVAERCFMDANKKKERLVPLDELSRQAKELGLADFDVKLLDRQLLDGNKERSRVQRLVDYITDNGQRLVTGSGKGYAVIPVVGWAYPAGVIRGKHTLVVIDWYNRVGAIRTKDVDRYQEIMKRYHRDLSHYKSRKKELQQQYSQARAHLTSESFWRDYLQMDAVAKD
ncbi:glycosyltransferase [Bifidobacterium aquikefiricola]|uniref:Glycosyltransferase n=1 Tax=Bifidobacterium aquikefiricola TaxID=3059038 RepID=A0AB39U6B7_9BIFI